MPSLPGIYINQSTYSTQLYSHYMAYFRGKFSWLHSIFLTKSPKEKIQVDLSRHTKVGRSLHHCAYALTYGRGHASHEVQRLIITPVVVAVLAAVGQAEELLYFFCVEVHQFQRSVQSAAHVLPQLFCSRLKLLPVRIVSLDHRENPRSCHHVQAQQDDAYDQGFRLFLDFHSSGSLLDRYLLFHWQITNRPYENKIRPGSDADLFVRRTYYLAMQRSHQKYYIPMYEELGCSSLTQMKWWW